MSGPAVGDGVQAAFGPGVAAADAAEGKPGAAYGTEAGDGDVSVFGAGGQVSALGEADSVEQGGDEAFVDLEGRGGPRSGLCRPGRRGDGVGVGVSHWRVRA